MSDVSRNKFGSNIIAFANSGGHSGLARHRCVAYFAWPIVDFNVEQMFCENKVGLDQVDLGFLQNDRA